MIYSQNHKLYRQDLTCNVEVCSLEHSTQHYHVIDALEMYIVLGEKEVILRVEMIHLM